jgi:hypothetical protein
VGDDLAEKDIARLNKLFGRAHFAPSHDIRCAPRKRGHAVELKGLEWKFGRLDF